MDPVRYTVGPRMSQATSANGMVFTSAQVAADLNADATVQTQQTLAKIDALLGAAGTSKENVLQATILLASIDDYAAMNAVWDAWVQPGAAPARLCYEAKFSSAKIKVEIAVVAVV
jgi:enamine deaminase RidA (YjgF/YER057c/UK114 family)